MNDLKNEVSNVTANRSLISETLAFEEDFIETYKNLPLLWDTEHKDYTNKYRRNEALDVMLKIMKRWSPSATRMHVRQKINIIRSVYKKDLRKHLESKSIGPNGEIVYNYEPVNWKFHALRFLDKNDDNNDTAEITEINMDDTNFEIEEGSDESASENGKASSHAGSPVHSTSLLASRLIMNNLKNEVSNVTANRSLLSETQAYEEDFIETYKNFPLLWDPEHEDYTNKYRRNEALDVMLKIMKRWSPSATLMQVRKKINTMRTVYQKDMRKHLESKSIGPNGEIVYNYVPANWKFHALRFLDKNDDNNDTAEITEINMDDTNFEIEEGSDESASENGKASSHAGSPVHSTSLLASRLIMNNLKNEVSNVTANRSLISETRAFEEDFIETYKNLPLLWDTEHEDYTNTCRRNEALDVMLKIMKRWSPSATRMHVRKKINIMRTAYKKGLRKHLESKSIGPNGEIVYNYEPVNWKFHALRFLDKNDDNNDTAEITEINMDDTNFEIEEGSDESASENGKTSSHTSDVLASMSEDEPPRKKIKAKTKKKSIKVEFDDYYQQNHNLLDQELEAIGANVTCKLKRMDPLQRYHAELLINKVLITGLKNNLSDETDLSDIYRA